MSVVIAQIPFIVRPLDMKVFIILAPSAVYSLASAPSAVQCSAVLQVEPYLAFFMYVLLYQHLQHSERLFCVALWVWSLSRSPCCLNWNKVQSVKFTAHSFSTK